MSDERLDTRALADVEAVLDRMDADFTQIGNDVPVGHPGRITLPDGHRVTGIVSRLMPRDGTPYADGEVLGPNLFDAARSGPYVADLLRFEVLGRADASL